MTDRTAWATEARKAMGGCCMGCGKRRSGLHVHEIERRSHAPTRWAHRCNYLLLCPTCHGGAFDCMPHAEQLGYKLYWDWRHYDLVAWLRLRDPEMRARARVLQCEVDNYRRDVQEKFNGR